MFNFQKFFAYVLRVLIGAAILIIVFFGLSRIAIHSYSEPLLATCPTDAISPQAIGVDADGRVVTATLAITGTSAITANQIILKYDVPTQTLGTLVTEASVITDNQIAHENDNPTETVGIPFTTTLVVYDSTPIGEYDIEITFKNDDEPTPLTATCKVSVLVTPTTTGGTPSLGVYMRNPIVDYRPTKPQYKSPERVLLGAAPGFLLLGLAIFLYSRFVTAMFSLNNITTGGKFLSYHMFGRPGFGPYLIVEQGKATLGEDIVKDVGGPAGLVVRLDSAIILEKAGKLTRIIRGPAFPTLEPFEKIWETIDLRQQYWDFPVKAMTQEGIPVTYQAAVTFKVGDTDADILEAAACKWIRDDERSDRLMYWVRRVIISATEGNFRRIISHYGLDDLIDGAKRREIRLELRTALSNSAPNNFGVTILDVTLSNLRFTHEDTEVRDKVDASTEALKEWYSQWKTRRELAIHRIETRRETELRKAEMQAESQIRQEMLDGVIEIIHEAAGDSEAVPYDYVVFSFLEMIKRVTEKRQIFIQPNTLQMLEDLHKRIEDLNKHPST